MASLAVVYIGEQRHASIAKDNHEKFLDAVRAKHSCRIYDFTHDRRDWSVEGLCSEQAQILDMHHALADITEPVVIKLRTDVWICPWEIDYIMDQVSRVLDQDLDFVYIGPCLTLAGEHRHAAVLERDDQPRWVQDILVILRASSAQDVADLLQTVTDQQQYQGNQGWWWLAKQGSRYAIEYRDVYLVRQARATVSDYQVVEDWYSTALLAVENTPAFARNLRLRDEWRSRYRNMTHEN